MVKFLMKLQIEGVMQNDNGRENYLNVLLALKRDHFFCFIHRQSKFIHVNQISSIVIDFPFMCPIN